MRNLKLVLAVLLLLPTLPAFASVTEPNGTVVPIDPGNGEVTLQSYFTSAGETLNAINDAHIQPDTFLPLCDFTAKFVLNQAGSHFGLAWYNVGATAPQPADLHTLIAANSPVGTTVTSANIRTDPAYTGGAIGFALVGGQTHYSESKWDVICTSCTPPAPWITAVIYKSTTTPNAYYVAFEDGNTTATSFANDGDFNDDVFLVSGLACQGGGVACSTGKMGVCATGVTECDQSGTLGCKQAVQPSGEVCNGLDDDCNGKIDDGATCAGGDICYRGQCVPPCGNVEFPCPGVLVCDPASQVCVDKGCVGVTCNDGQVCVNGQCQGGCTGVVCPHDQVCRAGRCVDPCAGVTCPKESVCQNGACVPSCACLPCTTGLACAPSGQCEDPGCVGTDAACMAGSYCGTNGMCVDECQGVTCPSGQLCKLGACVDAPPADMSMPPAADLGVPGDLGASGDGGAASDLGVSLDGGGKPGGKPAGCACELGGAVPIGAGALPLALFLLLFALRLRRRST